MSLVSRFRLVFVRFCAEFLLVFAHILAKLPTQFMKSRVFLLSTCNITISAQVQSFPIIHLQHHYLCSSPELSYYPLATSLSQLKSRAFLLSTCNITISAPVQSFPIIHLQHHYLCSSPELSYYPLATSLFQLIKSRASM